MKLKLAQQLMLAFSVMTLVVVMFALLVGWQSSTIKAVAEEVSVDDVPGAVYYLELMDEMGDMQTNVLEYLAGEDDEDDGFRANYEEYKRALELLKPLEAKTQTDRDKMALLDQEMARYAQTIEAEVFAKYDPIAERAAIKLADDTENGAGNDLEVILDRLTEEEFQDALKSTDLQESIRDDLPGVRAYLELLDEEGDMLRAMIEYINGESDENEAFMADAAKFREWLAILKPLEQKPVEVQNIAEIERLYQVIYDAGQTIFNSYNPDDKINAIRIVDELEHEIISKIDALLSSSAEEEVADAKAALENQNNLLDTLTSSLAIATVVAIFIAIMLGWVLSRSLAGRIERLALAARTIAKGDLTVAIEPDSRGDEVAELSSAIVEMKDSLRELLGQVISTANLANDSSSSMQQTSSEVASSSSQQVQRAETIAAAVEEMSVSADTVAAKCAEAAEQTKSAGDAANEGGTVVSQTVESINRIASVVRETAEKVDSLGARSQKIGEVMKVINDVAEQTNLLALNAAIEAARAGEQGRGFAVVADEVRGLAERTSQATQEVGDAILAIQNDTQAAIDRMQDGTNMVEDGVSLANSAGEALQRIVSDASAVDAMVQSIAEASSEQTNVTTEIARDISTINDVATDNSSVAQRAQETAGELKTQIADLTTIVRRFKL